MGEAYRGHHKRGGGHQCRFAAPWPIARSLGTPDVSVSTRPGLGLVLSILRQGTQRKYFTKPLSKPQSPYRRARQGPRDRQEGYCAKANKRSAEVRQVRKWHAPADRLAKSIRAEEEGLSPEDLATEIRKLWDKPAIKKPGHSTSPNVSARNLHASDRHLHAHDSPAGRRLAAIPPFLVAKYPQQQGICIVTPPLRRGGRFAV